MLRKAKNQNSTPFTLEMAETFFSAIKADFVERDQKLSTILDIVRVYDTERKEIKVNLWEHDRRIQKLEKQLA